MSRRAGCVPARRAGPRAGWRARQDMRSHRARGIASSGMAKARRKTAGAGAPNDDRRSGGRGAHRARARHDLRAARRAQRRLVRRAVQATPTRSAPSTPATSRAPPIWRSARRSRPASRRPIASCPGRACSIPRRALLTAYGMNAPVLALIGQIPAGRHRPRLRPSARDPRPGRHHRAAGRLFGAHPRAGRGAAPGRQGDRNPCSSSRPGPAALECAIDVWGRSGPVRPVAPLPLPRTADRRRCASRPPPSASAPPNGR